MLTQEKRESLMGEIFRASYEALSLDDLGSRILPLLDRLFATSTSLLYRCDGQLGFVPIAGNLGKGNLDYIEHYYAADPMQRALRRLNPLIFHAPSVPEWKEYLKHPAYTECVARYDADSFEHLRLNEFGYHQPGMVGMLFARTFRQPDFNKRDRLTLARLLPALQALTKRSERLDEKLRPRLLLEAMLELASRPKLALDPRGALLWASERAVELLGLNPGGRQPVPEVLVGAARRLGALLGKKPAVSAPPTVVAVPRKDAVPLHADLRLTRARNGVYFVIAELEDSGISPRLEETAARYQLTTAETQVLGLLSLGLSDREIGRRLFVSMPTVHSHVAHILDKLGVRSRVQAALLAHGHKPEVDSDRDF